MPRFRNFDDLNTHLEACCAKRWAEQLRAPRPDGSANAWNGIVNAALSAPSRNRLRLPATSARGGSVALSPWCAIDEHRLLRPHTVRHIARCWSAAMLHEVVISCAAEVIARHPRSYEQEDFVFDPLHYLSLLEHQDQRAEHQAAPLAGWLLPPVFGDLRRLLEARMGKAGKRE